jgi:hypothetical protein
MTGDWRARLFLAVAAAAWSVAGGSGAAAAGEAEARKLVAAARGHVLVITWSPLNVMRIDLGDAGRMSVIGTGLRHCDGPHPAGWRIDGGRLCLTTPWSTPCFDVAATKDGYDLEEADGRAVYTRVEDGPLGSCTASPQSPERRSQP